MHEASNEEFTHLSKRYPGLSVSVEFNKAYKSFTLYDPVSGKTSRVDLPFEGRLQTNQFDEFYAHHKERVGNGTILQANSRYR